MHGILNHECECLLKQNNFRKSWTWPRRIHGFGHFSDEKYGICIHHKVHNNCSKAFLCQKNGPGHLQQWRFLFCSCKGVSEDQDDAVSSEKHFGDVAIFVDWLWPLLALSWLGGFCPHLLYILKNHVTMSAKKEDMKAFDIFTSYEEVLDVKQLTLGKHRTIKM